MGKKLPQYWSLADNLNDDDWKTKVLKLEDKSKISPIHIN